MHPDADDTPQPGHREADHDGSGGEPVLVPHGELPPETLRRVIESFVLREGTEYGDRDYPLDAKVAHVLVQLRRGEAHVVFDPRTESVDIVPRSRLPRS